MKFLRTLISLEHLWWLLLNFRTKLFAVRFHEGFRISLAIKHQHYFLTLKLYGPFLWMGFNRLKARATSRRQFNQHTQSPTKFFLSWTVLLLRFQIPCKKLSRCKVQTIKMHIKIMKQKNFWKLPLEIMFNAFIVSQTARRYSCEFISLNKNTPNKSRDTA